MHEDSVYNRTPKGTKRANNYETRLATIRKNLSTQEDRLMKLRTDRLANKTPSHDEQVYIGVLKALQAEAGAAKYAEAASKAKGPAVTAGGEAEVEKKGPIKGSKGASKGG